MHLLSYVSSRAARSLAAASSLFVLAACGGGLGDSDGVSVDSITASATTLDCGAAAYASASLSYSGDVTSSDVTYLWTQESGSSVTLSSVTSAKVYFTAPASASSVVLKLTATAGSVSDSATVSFTVSGSSCS